MAPKRDPINQADLQTINANAPRRLLTLAAIKILKHFQKRQGTVLFLSQDICVKYGTSVNLSEAATLQFVAKHTSIPVPRIHCAFKRKDRTYIVMDRLKGDCVGDGWVHRSDESKAKILSQLKNFVDEMRRVPPPEGTGVAHINGGQLTDPRVPGPSMHFGPFSTIQEFHSYLRGGVQAHPDHEPEISRLIAHHDRPDHVSVLTHGDLSSLNILASGDTVTGIIDWETAGWYPAYWEYTSAWNVNPQNEFWRVEVDKFVQPMPEELEMNQIRLKYFGDI